MNPNHSMETGLSYPSVANLVILHSSLGETQEEIKEGKMKHLIFIPLLWSGGLQKSNPLQTDTKSTLQLSRDQGHIGSSQKTRDHGQPIYLQRERSESALLSWQPCLSSYEQIQMLNVTLGRLWVWMLYCVKNLSAACPILVCLKLPLHKQADYIEKQTMFEWTANAVHPRHTFKIPSIWIGPK